MREKKIKEKKYFYICAVCVVMCVISFVLFFEDAVHNEASIKNILGMIFSSMLAFYWMEEIKSF
jgi:surface polysaccharide O-acyltransferase-like enzyme